MVDDELELLLKRCRDGLAEISLNVKDLEGAPRQAQIVYSLDPPRPKAPPPPPQAAAVPFTPPPAPPPESPQPSAPRMAEPAVPTAPPEPQTPKPRTYTEDDDFPQLRMRPQTPPPSIPLWRAQPAPQAAEPVRPTVRIGRTAVVSATAAVALGGLALWAARRPPAEIAIDVKDAQAMTVRPEKGDVLVAAGKELLDFALDGRALPSRPLNAPVSSLDSSQGSLWSADGRTAAVTERADDGRETVYSLNHVPEALYVKEKYLWTSEKGRNVIHQFLISRSILGALLQPLDSYELDALAPEAFAVDDSGTLWLADSVTRRLFRLRIENGFYRPVSSAPLSPFIGPSGRMPGLSIEENAVWILVIPAGGGPSTLRRISLKRLDWTPA